MNVDAQFPTAPFAGAPQRPAQRPAGQESTRPVDRPQRDEAASNQTRQETEQVAERAPADQQAPADKSVDQGIALNTEETRELEQLKSRDREVRAHESAHKNAAGSLARGGASFEYANGPDGRRYAVGGEVSIDVSKANGDPQATIAKAQTIRRAALAPAQPSSQDFSVAANAGQLEAEARAELATQESNDSTATDKAPARGGFDTNPTQPASVGELLDVVA